MFAKKLALAAIAAVVAAASANTYVATTPTPTPKCYKEGEHCIGAAGHPAVPYIGGANDGCCDGLSCVADPSYNGWGKVCAKGGYAPTPTPAPKCYKEGEHCIGAAGHPAVPYIGGANDGCCDGLSCVADPSYNGWGKVCAKGGYTAAPTTTTKATTTTTTTKTTTTTTTTKTTTAAKCLAVGEKCNGSYLNCCEKSECKKNGYGNDSSCVAVY
jgi:hypothetical protein